MDVAKGGTARQTSTDNSGRFLAIDIQPGRYLISVEKTGFKKAELPLTLDVNSKMDVGQIKLEVGNVTEAVSVEGDSDPCGHDQHHGKGVPGRPDADGGIAHERPELHLFDEHHPGHEQRRAKRFQCELQRRVAVPFARRARI